MEKNKITSRISTRVMLLGLLLLPGLVMAEFVPNKEFNNTLSKRELQEVLNSLAATTDIDFTVLIRVEKELPYSFSITANRGFGERAGLIVISGQSLKIIGRDKNKAAFLLGHELAHIVAGSEEAKDYEHKEQLADKRSVKYMKAAGFSCEDGTKYLIDSLKYRPNKAGYADLIDANGEVLKEKVVFYPALSDRYKSVVEECTRQ